MAPNQDVRVRAIKKVILNNKFIEINEANFDHEVLNAMQPVLVEFWAGWSDQCKAMAPMLEFLAAHGSAPVRIARVNVEHHEDLTERYGVRSVPTLLIFNQGGVRDQIVGRTTEQTVRERLELAR
jgi:thioredoxin 1